MNVQTTRSDSVHELVHSCVISVWECGTSRLLSEYFSASTVCVISICKYIPTNQLFDAFTGLFIYFAQIMQLGTCIDGVRAKLYSVLVSAKRSIN